MSVWETQFPKILTGNDSLGHLYLLEEVKTINSGFVLFLLYWTGADEKNLHNFQDINERRAGRHPHIEMIFHIHLF